MLLLSTGTSNVIGPLKWFSATMAILGSMSDCFVLSMCRFMAMSAEAWSIRALVQDASCCQGRVFMETMLSDVSVSSVSEQPVMLRCSVVDSWWRRTEIASCVCRRRRRRFS